MKDKALISALNAHQKISYVTTGEEKLLKHIAKRMFDKGMSKEDIKKFIDQA